MNFLTEYPIVIDLVYNYIKTFKVDSNFSRCLFRGQLLDPHLYA